MNDLPGERAPDALVGTVLAGRYRILRLLGEGAMGAVYLGEHLKFGRKDAIKVLKSSMARDQEATRRFLRGAQNASAINHRNVCTVYDFSDTEEGLQFLAMEFVDGETLADLVEREGALPVDRAVPIITQAAAALEAAHDLGIVHRDLKPGNIMLARDRAGGDLVKVVDFDIAKGSREGEEREVTRLGFVVGTPEYMSPEQLTGDPLDGRSDVYSLALVLFRTVTGKLPIRSSSTQDLLVERLTEEPLTLLDVAPGRTFPVGLQPVIQRALQRRREDRWPSARDFSEALAAAVVRGGIAPSTGTTAARPVPPPNEPVPATKVSDSSLQPPIPPPPPQGWPTRLVLGLAAGAGVLAVVAVLAIRAFSADGIPPDEALTVAARQFDYLTGGGPEGLQAVEDTATRIIALDGAPSTARAMAGQLLARVNVTRGDTAAALRHLEDALALDPTLEQARTLLESLRRPPIEVATADAVLARQLERLVDPTLADLRSVSDTASLVLNLDGLDSPSRASAAYVLARASAAQGDTATAVSWLDRALEMDPGRVDADRLRRALTAGSVVPDPPRPTIPFGPGEAEDVVFRQMDRLVEPTPTRLQAAADTASMVVEMQAAPSSVRSVAAYVLAEVSVARGDTVQAIDWLNRAIAFDPGQQGPRTLLQRLRGG